MKMDTILEELPPQRPARIVTSRRIKNKYEASLYGKNMADYAGDYQGKLHFYSKIANAADYN